MQRPPRDPEAQLFGGATLLLALLQGLGVLAVVMGAYAWAHLQLSEPTARAFAFTTLVIANLALIFSHRSRARSLLASLLAPNATLWIVTGLALGLLTLALYLPGLSGVFRFAPLPPAELAVAVGLGLASVLWFQLLKLGPLTPRLVWGAVAFAGAAAVVASLALTPWLNLQPCQLCVFQRLLFMAIAVLALIAAVPTSVRGRWLPAVLTLSLAALGLAVAGYQSWLQFQPANMVSCSAGQLSRIEDLVEWLGQQVPTLFLAGGSCDETPWVVLGLSLANWAMFTFAAGLAVGGWALVHEYRAQCLPSVGPIDRRIAERRTHDRRSHAG